ncbi:protein rep [Dehalobacter sp.]|uniref:protein rep n=1 Tax=Dehalobacter sp. TaxID=1962289 RepID=UPI0025866D54|nr:protein rep [Dehalobacter sp.]MCG1026295.1 protein rep [Dehalobacter sp.]
MKNEILADSYKRLQYFSKSNRVKNCGSFLDFKRYHDNTLKLDKANFCKVRLCPLCSWRRSLKIFGQVSKIMDKITEENNYDFLFLTLTTKNCKGDDLSITIDKLMKAFKEMQRDKVYKNSILGYFRSLEVTHNLNIKSKSYDTYHPHFHCILVVRNSYFKKEYISQQVWTNLWQKCLDVDYTPIVHITRFKDQGTESLKKAIAESAKYTVKDNDYIVIDSLDEVDEVLTDKAVNVLDNALLNRRLTAYGGILKKIHKELNLDDPVDGDLINTDNDNLRNDLDYVIERYCWNVGYKQYYKVN